MPPSEATPLALADHVQGRGPALLLLHGGSGSHRHWDRVVAPLAQAFEVHAPDLPGFGESPDVPDATDGDGYVALAAEALDALLPGRPFDLVGFSFGGALAAAVARRRRGRLRRLTLLGPGGFGVPHGRAIATRSRKDTDGSQAARREVARHNLVAMMVHDPATIDERTVDQQMWNLAHARFNSLRVSFMDWLVDDVAAVDCPVQVCWGAYDLFAHPSLHARQKRIRAARPDVRFRVVPDAGHWVQHERPDEVVRLILDFHAGLPASTTETA